MGTPDFDFLGDSNPRALGKAPGAPCNPRRPAPQSRSNPLSRAKTRSAQMGSPGFAFINVISFVCQSSTGIQLASAAFLLHQHPRNQFGLAGLTAQMTEKQLGSFTADVVLHVREGSDSRAGHFTVPCRFCSDTRQPWRQSHRCSR